MSGLAVLLALTVVQAVATRAVELRTPVLDFGEAVRGRVVETRAEIVNGSDHEAQIRVAALGCGCLWTESLTLAGGAAGTLSIHLDTAKTPPGFVQRFVTIRVEPGGELLSVELRGTVYPPFRAAPQVLELAPGKGQVVVELHGALPFEVQSLLEPTEGWVWTARGLQQGQAQDVTLRRSTGSWGTAPPAFVFELKHRLGTALVEVPVVSSRPD